jgi:hypothetical protein
MLPSKETAFLAEGGEEYLDTKYGKCNGYNSVMVTVEVLKVQSSRLDDLT